MLLTFSDSGPSGLLYAVEFFLIQVCQSYCMLLIFSDSGPSGLLHAAEFF